MPTFGDVVDEYDHGRPSYPPALYDALGHLQGALVLDVGAGTGIATRQLLERGARVLAIDPGRRMLSKAVGHTPGLPAVVADGAAAPVRDRSVDLVCFAQSWHWLAPFTRVQEIHRVLRPGGRWAGWWSHARADGEAWFDDYWSTIESMCTGTHRSQRDTDWGATVDERELFVPEPRVTLPWTRSTSTEAWLTDQASHSYVDALPQRERDELLGRLRQIIEDQFPTGAMAVRYETWLWTATRTP